MPTGYTAFIEEGCSFEAYVWQCARAFGACVTMRDDPSGAAIPEAFEPSDYHAKRLKEIHATIDKIRDMTEEEVIERQARDNQERKDHCEKSRKDQARLKGLYAKMWEKVADWGPPTAEHCGLKKFMLQQIEVSTPNWEPEPYKEEFLRAKEWRELALASAYKDLAYHEKEHREEIERTESRNGWLRALRESVPQPKEE